jgi:hypothetical protein
MHLEEPTVTSQPSGSLADKPVSLAVFDWTIAWKRDLPKHNLITLPLHQTLLSVFFRYVS